MEFCKFEKGIWKFDKYNLASPLKMQQFGENNIEIGLAVKAQKLFKTMSRFLISFHQITEFV